MIVRLRTSRTLPLFFFMTYFRDIPSDSQITDITHFAVVFLYDVTIKALEKLRSTTNLHISHVILLQESSQVNIQTILKCLTIDVLNLLSIPVVTYGDQDIGNSIHLYYKIPIL